MSLFDRSSNAHFTSFYFRFIQIRQGSRRIQDYLLGSRIGALYIARRVDIDIFHLHIYIFSALAIYSSALAISSTMNLTHIERRLGYPFPQPTQYLDRFASWATRNIIQDLFPWFDRVNPMTWTVWLWFISYVCVPSRCRCSPKTSERCRHPQDTILCASANS